MSITDKQRQAIDEIMGEFDFGRVHQCMTALRWEWQGKGVPSSAMLRLEAARLLLECCDSPKWKCISTGGFTVSRDDGVLSLSFDVESAEADIKETP